MEHRIENWVITQSPEARLHIKSDKTPQALLPEYQEGNSSNQKAVNRQRSANHVGKPKSYSHGGPPYARFVVPKSAQSGQIKRELIADTRAI